MKNRIATRLTLMMLAVGLASPALAVDGVLEINETCAVNTGCFNGDTAGFPVTIIRAGSYRLTSNLTVPDEDTSGIVVYTNYVSIDLNGFAITGPVTCSGSPATCSHASGTGSGVEVTFPDLRTGTSVGNGSITGMGAWGVQLGYEAKVTNLRARWNRTGGVGVSEGGAVSNNTTDANGYYGIATSVGSVVSGNRVLDNGIHGITVGSGSMVSGNTVRGNGGYGLFFSGTNSAYSENVVSNNTGGTVTGSAVQLG